MAARRNGLNTDDVSALADVVARRVIELLEPRPSEDLVDAATLASHLGVQRCWIYRNAEALGAIRLGSQPRAPLRFALERAVVAAQRMGQA